MVCWSLSRFDGVPNSDKPPCQDSEPSHRGLGTSNFVLLCGDVGFSRRNEKKLGRGKTIQKTEDPSTILSHRSHLFSTHPRIHHSHQKQQSSNHGRPHQHRPPRRLHSLPHHRPRSRHPWGNNWQPAPRNHLSRRWRRRSSHVRCRWSRQPCDLRCWRCRNLPERLRAV